MTEAFLQATATALQAGDPVEAERLCRTQLKRTPDEENALLLLALSLQHQDRRDEAAPLYARLTELFPDSALHWTNYSTALRTTGKAQEAVDAAARAVQLEPGDAAHQIALGQAYLALHDHAAAYDALITACDLDPDSPEAHIDAAAALSDVRDAQAFRLLRGWRKWLPLDDADLQLKLAHLLTTNGDGDGAYDVLVELIRRRPDYLLAQIQLAALFERRNELDKTEALLAHVDARAAAEKRAAPEAAAHVRAKLALRRGDLGQARTLLKTSGPRSEFDPTHYFTLAEIEDKAGDTAAVMRELATAHAVQAEDRSRIKPTLRDADAPPLPSAVGRVSAQEYAAWPRLTAPSMQDSPVFIVGFPRSGTTLLEQMLDAHPALQSMDEQPFFTILGTELAELGLHLPNDLGRLNQRDCDELRKRYLGLVCEKIPRNWNTRLVDKNPLNMLWLPMIDRLFPHGKIILCLRHPCDVVLSNYMQNFRSTTLASATSTLERAARAYVAAFEAWLYHVDVFKPDVFVSRYEELVANLPQQTQRIAAFLELEDATPMQQFDRHAREKGFIATPSYSQVVQPVNRKGMNRWLRYREYFEPVLPILEPMLKHWGYAVDA